MGQEQNKIIWKQNAPTRKKKDLKPLLGEKVMGDGNRWHELELHLLVPYMEEWKVENLHAGKQYNK
jgi:hypothetical protein